MPLWITALIRVLIALLVMFQSDCDGGSGNGTFAPTSSGKLNPTLSGTSFIYDDNQAWILDIQEGSFTRISTSDWSRSSAYHNLARFSALPAGYDGSEIIVTVRNCRASNDGTSCVIIADATMNTILDEFDVYGDIRGIARLSKDKQYVALVHQYGSISGDTWLEIYNRKGELISDYLIDNTLADISFDWLNDGSLVFSLQGLLAGNSIYVTQPYTATIERTLTLPAAINGIIGNVSVSPDGSQITFSLISDSNTTSLLSGVTHATPWVVDIDGSNLHQLAIDPHAATTDDSIINSPRWSADGKLIYVRYGGAGGVSPIAPGVLGYLFAVPADGIEVRLSPYDKTIATTAVQVKSKWGVLDGGQSTPDINRWPNISLNSIL